MLSKKLSLAVLASNAVFIGLAAWAITTRTPPPPSPLPKSAPEKLSRTHVASGIEARLDGLASDVDALWELQDEERELVPQADAIATAHEVEDKASESPEAAAQRMRDIYEAQVLHEPADASWAPRAEKAVEERLDDMDVAITSIERLECRSTLCVVEFHYDAEDDGLAGLAEALGQLAPWPSQTTSSLSTTGDQQGWLYVSREGMPLPDA